MVGIVLPGFGSQLYHLLTLDAWLTVSSSASSSVKWAREKLLRLKCSVCLYSQSLNCVQLFTAPWTVAHQTPLCPWDFPGKNTGVGCHFLLQGIFPPKDQTLVLCLLHWQVDSLLLHHLGRQCAQKQRYFTRVCKVSSGKKRKEI